MNQIELVLLYWRQKRALSQSELARKAHLTQATLSRLERGQEKPQFQTLQKCASVLGIELSDFFVKPKAPALTRFQVDAIARAILSGERKLKPPFNQLADQCARVMINQLKACSVPGKKRVQAIRWQAPYRKIRLFATYSPHLIFQILDRAHKLLPAYMSSRGAA